MTANFTWPFKYIWLAVHCIVSPHGFIKGLKSHRSLFTNYHGWMMRQVFTILGDYKNKNSEMTVTSLLFKSNMTYNVCAYITRLCIASGVLCNSYVQFWLNWIVINFFSIDEMSFVNMNMNIGQEKKEERMD